MRTIDADALKKEIASHEREFAPDWVLNLIDNAPTIKFSLLPADESKEEAYMRGYKKGRIEGILKAHKTTR